MIGEMRDPVSVSEGGVSRSELRSWCGISVTSVAKLSGVTELVIRSWEKGDDVRHALAGKYSSKDGLDKTCERIASVYAGMLVTLARGQEVVVGRDGAIESALQRLKERLVSR